MKQKIALINSQIFDGHNWLNNHHLVLKNGVVENISTEIPQNVDVVINANNKLLVPAFVELQVYGSGGNLFSAFPREATLAQMESHLHSHGTAAFLACVATNTDEVMYNCIRAAKAFSKHCNGFLGLHLEGPYLNATKRGAHIESFIRKATLDEVKKLLDFADGTIKMITIAPEMQDDQVIQYLLDHQIVLSLGHSNATFEEATAAYNSGIQTTTHLFNAMSAIHHREPGIPTALFNHKTAISSIIADGNHVHFDVIKFASAVLKERLFLITDTVAACNVGPYKHRLEGDKFVTDDGTLSGANIHLLDAVKNCVNHCEIELDLALKMAALFPAKLLGLDTEYGTIEIGKPAKMLLLNGDLSLEQTF